MIGKRNRLWLVLHHQHGISLIAQCEQQIVHSLDICRVQACRRLVEYVGHVGQRGSQVANHARALRLTTG